MHFSKNAKMESDSLDLFTLLIVKSNSTMTTICGIDSQQDAARKVRGTAKYINYIIEQSSRIAKLNKCHFFRHLF